MYENDYLYAVERDGDYLAHYGIKGMRWGVRKAIESGNSRALGRQYAKAQKKLAKLEKRANSGKKYARRAALMGAGAAAAGGLAIAGTDTIGRAMQRLGGPAASATKGLGRALTKVPGRGKVSQALHRTGAAMYNNNQAVSGALKRSGAAVRGWGNSRSIVKGINAGGNSAIDSGIKALQRSGKAGRNLAQDLVTKDYVKGARGALGKVQKSNISNNTIARIGAGAIGAGLAGAAGYNAYRAATTKRAAQKAAQFRSEMNKAFKGTQYANGAPRQGKKRRM